MYGDKDEIRIKFMKTETVCMGGGGGGTQWTTRTDTVFCYINVYTIINSLAPGRS